MTAFQTSREIPAPPQAVFAAIRAPERLARWWGPAGFRNTFSVCEFQTGGRWSFVMHGPDGTDYPNECIFEAVEAEHRVVVRHANAPHFRLTITLAASATGTLVSWHQAFDEPRVAEQVRHIVVPANEQNLDRLTAEVTQAAAGSAGPAL